MPCHRHPNMISKRDDSMKIIFASSHCHVTKRLAGNLKKALCCLPLMLLAACAAPRMQPSSQAGAAAVTAAPAEAAHRSSEQSARSERDVEAAPEKIAALRSWVDRQDRLYAVAAPLLIGNTALCKRNTQALLGLSAKTQYSYSNYFADAARAAYGLDDRLRVMSVLAGSGAEKSGIRRGDVLLAVECRAGRRESDRFQNARTQQDTSDHRARRRGHAGRCAADASLRHFRGIGQYRRCRRLCGRPPSDDHKRHDGLYALGR